MYAREAGGSGNSQWQGTGTIHVYPSDGSFQYIYNDYGGFTLSPAPRLTQGGVCFLEIHNGPLAGTISLTGWAKVNGSFDKTDGNIFMCRVSIDPFGQCAQLNIDGMNF